MSDLEKECDATLKTAQTVLAETERLVKQAEGERAAFLAWKKANGLDAEKEARFFASLSTDDMKKVEEERTSFERELAHDLEALSRREGQAAPKKRRPRNLA